MLTVTSFNSMEPGSYLSWDVVLWLSWLSVFEILRLDRYTPCFINPPLSLRSGGAVDLCFILGNCNIQTLYNQIFSANAEPVDLIGISSPKKKPHAYKSVLLLFSPLLGVSGRSKSEFSQSDQRVSYAYRMHIKCKSYVRSH